MERHTWICDRLTHMGYARERRIRLYGEEMDLISNPVAESDGFVVDAILRKSGARRRIHIPLMTVRVLEHELEVNEETALAA